MSMKTNTQMDKILKEATKDPELLREILPVYQSFAGYGNIEPYQHYQVQTNKICQKWLDTNSMAVIVRDLTEAWIQFCQGKFDYSLKVILELSSKHDLKINLDHYGFAELLLGNCLRNKGEIDTALVHLLNAAKSINEHGPLAISSCFAHYHLAELHMQISDIDDAGEYYKKALAIAQRVDHNVSTFRSLSGLGSWYHSKSEHEKCIQHFDLALKVESISDALKSRALRDLGIHYLSLKSYKKAISFLDESYQLAFQSGYLGPASTSLIHLGETYLSQNNPNKALSKLNEALKLSLSHRTRTKQMEIEALLAVTHEALQNFEKAYEHLKIAQKLEHEISTIKQREIYKIKNRLIEEQKRII